MTAILQSRASPGSGFHNEDEDSQSWEFLESLSPAAGSFAGSGSGCMPVPSPSIVSQGSWTNIIPHNAAAGHQMRALSTPSPVMSQNNHAVSASPYSVDATFGTMSASHIDSGSGAMAFDFSDIPFGTQQHAQQQQQQQHFVAQPLLVEQIAALAPQDFTFSHTPQDLMISGFNTGFNTMSMLPEASYTTLEQQAQFSQQLGIPLSMQAHANADPWDPTSMQNNVFVQEQFTTPPPNSDASSSLSHSPSSPASPAIKQEPRSAHSKKKTSPQSVHLARKPAGVQKTQQKKKTPTPPRSGADSPDHKLSDGIIMFCNQTVDNWGKSHGFGDLENIERSSHKGRKGALSEEVRANALKVRQTGACFCCHVRKVKCDQQRPCKNCVKLCSQVPEAVCWKFQDFNDVLFPDFIRGHFRRDEMAKFVDANVASFTLNGVEVPARVTLSSGPTFGTKLVVNAKFFTAKDASSDIMRQWFQFHGARGVVELDALRAAPIGLDYNMDGVSTSMRSELRRKVEAYVGSLVSEPSYALQLTDSIRKTTIPCKVLQLVQQYAQASGSPIVRRALSIYAMHYVMTRHLTMTPQTIASLQAINPVAATGSFLTPRLLNRQIKTVVDDVMQQEVNLLFDDFTKRLKKKKREEWAPCLAAFLVFTLLMEAIETAADVFSIAENEIEMRNRQPARFRRAFALSINEEIENMPFKQFAYQFHHIYQTHSRDASAKAFNPLLGEDLNDLGELGPGGLELVLGLRGLVQFACKFALFRDAVRERGPRLALTVIVGSELDWLSYDPILPSGDDHPYPMNVEENYVGRLVAKFLLSFDRPGYIFASA